MGHRTYVRELATLCDTVYNSGVLTTASNTHQIVSLSPFSGEQLSGTSAVGSVTLPNASSVVGKIFRIARDHTVGCQDLAALALTPLGTLVNQGCFSNDGLYYFVLSKRVITVYSTTTWALAGYINNPGTGDFIAMVPTDAGVSNYPVIISSTLPYVIQGPPPFSISGANGGFWSETQLVACGYSMGVGGTGTPTLYTGSSGGTGIDQYAGYPFGGSSAANLSEGAGGHYTSIAAGPTYAMGVATVGANNNSYVFNGSTSTFIKQVTFGSGTMHSRAVTWDNWNGWFWLVGQDTVSGKGYLATYNPATDTFPVSQSFQVGTGTVNPTTVSVSNDGTRINVGSSAGVYEYTLSGVTLTLSSRSPIAAITTSWGIWSQIACGIYANNDLSVLADGKGTFYRTTMSYQPVTVGTTASQLIDGKYTSFPLCFGENEVALAAVQNGSIYGWKTLSLKSRSAGSTYVDFGTTGVTDATATISGAFTNLVGRPTCHIAVLDSPDHTADEHNVEEIEVRAGNVVAGTSFTIYARTRNFPLYGKWNVNWSWT